MLNSLSRQIWPRFSFSSIIMPPISLHDCSSFSSSSFHRKPVPPVINITRTALNCCNLDAMSSSSKQKESKQPFEQQLSYISAYILFVGNKGLTRNRKSAVCYVIFGRSAKGISSSSEM